MKIKYYFYMAMAALVMTNCSQEEELQDIQQDLHTLTATIEGSTSRSAVTDGGIFSWTSGDAISVWNGSSYQQCTYSGTGNNFGNAPSQMSGYAIYPHGNHPNYSGSGLPQVNLKSSYTYGSTNAIMLAKVQSGSRNLSFNHLGGLMRFTIKNIPSGASSFTFTANTGITGNFQVQTENGANVIKTTTVLSSNKTVTITFTGNQSERTFYVPLPIGTYNGFKIQIGSLTYTSQASNTINRRTLLLMPTFTCNGSQLVKGENSFKLENAEQEMNVGGNESLMIETPASGTNAQLTLNCTPETNNSTLNISDGQTGASTDSKAKVVVNVTNNQEVSKLNIDAPTLTVELANGTYDEITAKTAKQTLIIKKGVTVKKLTVLGGKVEIESGATVTNKTELRILTFEDEDAKFTPYKLNYANKTISKWSDLVDDAQYGGTLTYNNFGTATYHWYDQNNTELEHSFTTPYWGGGHAISNFVINNYETLPSGYYGWYELQFATPIGGHNNSSNFCIHNGYADFFNIQQYDGKLAWFSFKNRKEQVVDHMYVTNTCYVLNSLTYGDGFNSPASNDTWVKIVAYGYNANEEEVGTTEFYLCNTGRQIVTDWKKWDLSSLGKVNKIVFNFAASNDQIGSYGLNCPAYFAYDDVAVQFTE